MEVKWQAFYRDIYQWPGYRQMVSHSHSVHPGLEGTVIMFDINGRKVLTRQIAGNRIDISTIKPGYYSIRINAGNGIEIRKFLKQWLFVARLKSYDMQRDFLDENTIISFTQIRRFLRKLLDCRTIWVILGLGPLPGLQRCRSRQVHCQRQSWIFRPMRPGGNPVKKSTTANTDQK